MTAGQAVSITLSKRPDGAQLLTINGEPVADATDVWLHGTAQGFVFSLHREMTADGQRWETTDEFILAEMDLTAKAVRR